VGVPQVVEPELAELWRWRSSIAETRRLATLQVMMCRASRRCLNQRRLLHVVLHRNMIATRKVAALETVHIAQKP
jgi:hypothetical protein